MTDVKFTQVGGVDETKVTFISGNQKTISTEEKGKFNPPSFHLISYTEIMLQSVNQHLFHQNQNSKASWFHVIRSDKMDKNQHFYRLSFNIIASAMIIMPDSFVLKSPIPSLHGLKFLTFQKYS